MKQSQLFCKTFKEVPADADSINASYLIRAGFVEKHMAGVYALLPLGSRVYKKIENIIIEEMNAIEGQELLMNVLQPKELWDETGRWESLKDVFYRMTDDRGNNIGLAPTHEEQVVEIVRNKIKSYKNLPLYLYQIQTKFRNEPRAKSGLLRGREFIMKDLYSFSENEEDFKDFYKKISGAYLKIFKRLGLSVKYVEASGGPFAKEHSHEFQVLTPVGEDVVFYCSKCDFAQNKEISEVKAGDKCSDCEGEIKSDNGIEVGNIFTLGYKYSHPMGLTFLDKEGKEKEVYMGSYGIGLTRCLATIVEVHYNIDKNMMVWPENVAPFKVHLLSLRQDETAEKIYKLLLEKNIEVLFDDRELSAGEKFAEADLIGSPIRIIVSEKTVKEESVELIEVSSGKCRLVKINQLLKEIADL